MGLHLSFLSWRLCATEVCPFLTEAARSLPGFIWRMRQPPRLLPSNRAGEAYNIVDDEPVRNQDFFSFLCQQAHLPKPFSLPGWMIHPIAPLATDFFSTSMCVSNAKAVRELGWKPVLASTYRRGIPQALEVLDQQELVSSEGKK